MFGSIKITNFGKCHFDQKFGGTKITDISSETFEKNINNIINGLSVDGSIMFGTQEDLIKKNGYKIINGYAPFCKLIAVKNFTNAKVGSMKIDVANYQYLRHGYSSRVESELPVMSRWFELPVSVPLAEYLIVVVYSKEQLEKEHYATIEKNGGAENPEHNIFDFDADWGIVAILGQTHPEEEPMQPITMMRNALGVEEGGSGVSLNREKYLKSVEFWSHNAIIKS